MQCSVLAGGGEARHGQGPDSQWLRSARIYLTGLPPGCLMPPTACGTVLGRGSLCVRTSLRFLPLLLQNTSPSLLLRLRVVQDHAQEGPPFSFSPLSFPRALKQPSSFHHSSFLQAASSPTKLDLCIQQGHWRRRQLMRCRLRTGAPSALEDVLPVSTGRRHPGESFPRGEERQLLTLSSLIKLCKVLSLELLGRSWTNLETLLMQTEM